MRMQRSKSFRRILIKFYLLLTTFYQNKYHEIIHTQTYIEIFIKCKVSFGFKRKEWPGDCLNFIESEAFQKSVTTLIQIIGKIFSLIWIRVQQIFYIIRNYRFLKYIISAMDAPQSIGICLLWDGDLK
jgi:hypothetical protein